MLHRLRRVAQAGLRISTEHRRAGFEAERVFVTGEAAAPPEGEDDQTRDLLCNFASTPQGRQHSAGRSNP